ncbi:MAG TPA: acyltransferase [Sedimentisphaerales bacterium]|nr:acyltransferase [Sedimentisphaerales bacterium]
MMAFALRLLLTLYGYKVFHKKVRVHGFFKVMNPRNVQIGDNLSINHGVFIQARNKICLGNNVTLSPYCMLLDSGLNVDDIWKSRDYARHIDGTIIIGDGVWIGGGAIVLSGVSIGPHSVVGAGSVVTKSFPEGVVIAGNPARVIREVPRL